VDTMWINKPMKATLGELSELRVGLISCVLIDSFSTDLHVVVVAVVVAPLSSSHSSSSAPLLQTNKTHREAQKSISNCEQRTFYTSRIIRWKHSHYYSTLNMTSCLSATPGL
jgi:hypothetical protein